MKLFRCPNCDRRIYFENSRCLSCGSTVIYSPDSSTFVLEADGHRPCENTLECGCNWEAAEGARFCRACGLNKTIPDLSIPGNREKWARVEAAKRRTVYGLLLFGLEVAPKRGAVGGSGIAFDFLADAPGGGPGGEHVLTGHDNGLITLNVAEADSVERERRRLQMGEPYRTLLGHFRHELGHYYWDCLIRDDSARLERFRAVFGDERSDYAAALEAHYSGGAPADWQLAHISAYAASHPWEDWAETWAHYLHITDTLEMVQALDIPLAQVRTVDPNELEAGDTGGGTDTSEPFDVLLERWLVLSEASNAINRCMGLPDLYPFVISAQAGRKLAFVHELLNEVRVQRNSQTFSEVA